MWTILLANAAARRGSGIVETVGESQSRGPAGPGRPPSPPPRPPIGPRAGREERERPRFAAGPRRQRHRRLLPERRQPLRRLLQVLAIRQAEVKAEVTPPDFQVREAHGPPDPQDGGRAADPPGRVAA